MIVSTSSKVPTDDYFSIVAIIVMIKQDDNCFQGISKLIC